MAKNQRVVDNAFLNSGTDIQSIEYNPASGGQKVLGVGPRYIPIQIAGGFTTDVSGTAVALPFLGANLAIYNTSGTAGSVTAGASTITSLGIGATDANGNVGVPCQGNAWTYLSMGNNQYIISSASTLKVFIIEDPTRIAQETGPYAQQFVNGTILPVNS